MQLIFAAALCSVWVSILLKICKKKGLEPMQMIMWNYAIASLLCWWWFQPNWTHVSLQQTPWWLILSLSLLLPSIFLCLSKSLNYAGILKTEIAQRLSVVLSLSAAYLLFQEQFNSFKMLGIGLGVFAVGCILWSQPQHDQTTSKKGILYLSCVWLGYALIDVLLKYTSSLGLQFPLTLNLMFIGAFVISTVYLVWNKKNVFDYHHIVAGLLLGILNFANIAFYVKAHLLLKHSPAIVFAGMNILVVAFGVIAGIFIFKEKLKPSIMLGLILAFMSVFCLAYAMQYA